MSERKWVARTGAGAFIGRCYTKSEADVLVERWNTARGTSDGYVETVEGVGDE